jgi:predicted nucleotide-binding protein (sugar kinase/HSP70/actin superfamily)
MGGNGNSTLEGKKLWIHPMTQASARLLAAVFRSTGVDASILPPSDARTLELGAMHSTGEECLPEKITIGDYLKVTEAEGFDPAKTAFFMPASDGPCRFGQYWPLLGMILRNLGYGEVTLVNPSSSNGYQGIGGNVLAFFRKAWVAVIVSDIFRKMLLKTRPYERVKGTTDAVYERSLRAAEALIERDGLGYGELVRRATALLGEARSEFRAIDAAYVRGKPLIAVIGEIFCRHNRFANEDMIRKLEEHGAETWIADVGEWIFYTDWSRRLELGRMGKNFSKEMVLSRVKTHFMKRYEHTLLAQFHEDFTGYEEPEDVGVVTGFAEPYLPARGALGEMCLSLGKSGYCHGKGADGIVDISPFSCMNGIVSEAVYPSFSRDHDSIPCRVFYYDGVKSDLDRDIGIFMELVRGYMARKKVERVYPPFFVEG